MRVFTQEYLKYKRDKDGEAVLDEFDEPIERSRVDLQNLLYAVECGDASFEDKEKNIAEIKVALNGGVRCAREDVIKDIQAGLADISDMGGMN